MFGGGSGNRKKEKESGRITYSSGLIHPFSFFLFFSGIGLLPPQGWRSWNCFGADVNQTLMESVMDSISNRSRTAWNGDRLSLSDLGFINVGLDDAWQECGAGIHGGFHDASGNPIVDTALFPNMTAMTDKGHSLGLRVGWYMNNCICKEKGYTDEEEIRAHMEQSAKAVAEYGFDGVKLDGCGQVCFVYTLGYSTSTLL